MTAVSRLAGAIGQLWIFAFVALFGTYLATWAVGLRIPAILLYVLPLLAWAAWRLHGPRDRLDFAVMVALVVHGFVSLASRDQFGSLEATGMALAFALLFWLMREVGSRPGVQGRVAVAVLVALGLWLVAARSAVSRRTRALGFADVAERAGRFVDSRTPAQLVGGAALAHYHRSGCRLAAGRPVTPAERSSHERLSRRPCGVCRP